MCSESLLNETLGKLDFTNDGSTNLSSSGDSFLNSFGSCVVAKDKCHQSMILERWLAESTEDDIFSKSYKAIVYLLSLLYMLFGVGIITDRIVGAAEVISSHKVVRSIKFNTGATRNVRRRLWHPIVANMLFVLPGTSSPEILLPLIYIFRNNFELSELGSTLIIGSGAYHFFIITAVCLFVAKDSSGKPIYHLGQFFATSAFATFAFLYVFLVLNVISPDVIEIWEAIVMLAMYPMLILCSWAISKNYILYILYHTREFFEMACAGRATRSRSDDVTVSSMWTSAVGSDIHDDNSEDREVRRKRQMAGIKLRQLRKQYPEKSQSELETIVETELAEDSPKSGTFYRLAAVKALYGGTNNKVHSLEDRIGIQRRINSECEMTTQSVGFKTDRMSCIESCRTISIPVERFGEGIRSKMLTVDYETTAATAKENRNFIPVSNGQLVFSAGETLKDITIRILDDGIYEETAKFFKVKINGAIVSNPRMLVVPSDDPLTELQTPQASPSPDHRDVLASLQKRRQTMQLPTIIMTKQEITISILDDDHSGIFSFEKTEIAISDSIGTAKIKVTRQIGTKFTVIIPYRIIPGTAKANDDYIVSDSRGSLLFEDGQFDSFIEIDIIDKDRFGEVANFYIEIFPPRKVHLSESDKHSSIGLPRLGSIHFVQVGICESAEMREALNRLISTPEIPRHIIALGWREQIRSSFSVYKHNIPENLNKASYYLALFRVYIFHFIAFPWKFLVALLPPARLLHGYISYFSLLFIMAIVAALIGDCASLFACTIGLNPLVTAVTLLPLGTGLPDTFASKNAAVNEKSADLAIGGVMGSNAISVFIGVGLTWTICSIYDFFVERPLQMHTTSFGFSVVVFCALETIGILVLLLRRLPPIRGELGGPTAVKYLSGAFFIFLWLAFVTLSISRAYCLIELTI